MLPCGSLRARRSWGAIARRTDKVSSVVLSGLGRLLGEVGPQQVVHDGLERASLGRTLGLGLTEQGFADPNLRRLLCHPHRGSPCRLVYRLANRGTAVKGDAASPVGAVETY